MKIYKEKIKEKWRKFVTAGIFIKKNTNKGINATHATHGLLQTNWEKILTMLLIYHSWLIVGFWILFLLIYPIVTWTFFGELNPPIDSNNISIAPDIVIDKSLVEQKSKPRVIDIQQYFTVDPLQPITTFTDKQKIWKNIIRLEHNFISKKDLIVVLDYYDMEKDRTLNIIYSENPEITEETRKNMKESYTTSYAVQKVYIKQLGGRTPVDNSSIWPKLLEIAKK